MRRALVIGAALVAVAAAAYTLFWFRAADALSEGVAGWAAARRAEGWTVALGQVAVRGFPLKLEAVVGPFAIGRDAPVRWRWSGARLAASVPPWGGDKVTLDAPGAHRIEADLPDRPLDLALDAATAHGTARIGAGGKIVRLDAVLAGVAGRSVDGSKFHADSVLLAVAGGSAAARDPAQPPPAGAAAAPQGQALHPPEAGSLHITAQGLDLPDGAAPPLGPHVDRAEVDVALDGALPSGPSRAALDAWRRAGGTVELRKVAIDWGRFKAEADGTLALDADMQPIGAFTTRMSGVDDAVDSLVAAGRLKARARAMAKIVLRMMAKPSPDPAKPPEIDVPLTLQDRTLYLGPAALAHVPRIDWPGPVEER